MTNLLLFSRNWDSGNNKHPFQYCRQRNQKDFLAIKKVKSHWSDVWCRAATVIYLRVSAGYSENFQWMTWTSLCSSHNAFDFRRESTQLIWTTFKVFFSEFDSLSPYSLSSNSHFHKKENHTDLKRVNFNFSINYRFRITENSWQIWPNSARIKRLRYSIRIIQSKNTHAPHKSNILMERRG